MVSPTLAPVLSLALLPCQERCLQLPGHPHPRWGMRANEIPKFHEEMKPAPPVTGAQHGEWSCLPCAAWLLMGVPRRVFNLLEVVLGLGGSRGSSSVILAASLHVELGSLFLPHLLGLLCRSRTWRGQGLQQEGLVPRTSLRGALGATLSQKSEPVALDRDFCSCTASGMAGSWHRERQLSSPLAPMACTVPGNVWTVYLLD